MQSTVRAEGQHIDNERAHLLPTPLTREPGNCSADPPTDIVAQQCVDALEVALAEGITERFNHVARVQG